MEDKRFIHVISDPKFRRIPKAERKVKIDKRFKSMFKDKKFKVKYTVDSRGRPVNRTSTEDLKRYYHLSSEESCSSEEDENEQENDVQSEARKIISPPKHSESETELNDLVVNESDIKVTVGIKKKLKNLQVDYARGEGKLFSESSSDDESSPEDLQVEEIQHNWGELDGDAERTDKITYRLAACNMDWDRIRAVDLMVLFNSFLPQASVIKSIAIYPSEFGKQRLKEEEVNGPTELVDKKLENPDEDEENEEGPKYHMEKLRQYQLNRLKYYYAVITCDSPSTANKIYTECDGMEYESSAIKIDLRFIPDDMVFDDDPKETCNKLPEVAKYEPRFFTTTALQQAKVNLTWDETNPDRVELTQKIASGKIDEIDESDLQAYLAYSSEEEESEDDEEIEQDESESENSQLNPIDKYRALLSEIEMKEKEKKEKDVEMEISWGIDLEKKTNKLIKQKQSESENKTPFEHYLEKRKEKRKEKREEKKKKLEDGEQNNNSEEENDVPSDINLDDPYFAEEFQSAEFKQKKKNKHKSKAYDENNEVDKQNQAELELLLMNDDDKKHFNMKKIQEQENEGKSKKRKKQIEEKVDEFEVNVDDERFSALYTSHHYNIDPTDSHYKKTNGMEKLINEKLKRRKEEQQEEIDKKLKGDVELNVLVKSVKRKTQAFVNKKS
ncbi:hypothetical protein Trydic_g7502 [Trypoxylus dichotomus]